MQILFSILTVLFILVSLMLVLIVLVQRPQGGGLTGAFGGGGGTDTAFGGRTGDALTVATITAFGIYLLIAIGLNITSNRMIAASAEPAAIEEAPADGAAAPATDPSGAPATTPEPTPATTSGPTPILDGSNPDDAARIRELISDTAPAPAPSAAEPVPAPAPAPAPAPGGS